MSSPVIVFRQANESPGPVHVCCRARRCGRGRERLCLSVTSCVGLTRATRVDPSFLSLSGRNGVMRRLSPLFFFCAPFFTDDSSQQTGQLRPFLLYFAKAVSLSFFRSRSNLLPETPQWRRAGIAGWERALTILHLFLFFIS